MAKINTKVDNIKSKNILPNLYNNFYFSVDYDII